MNIRNVGAAMFLLLAVCLPGAAPANWSEGTADILPAGRLELGFGRPCSYGINPRFELSSYLPYAPLFPNIETKISWRPGGRLRLASTHALSCPTPLLRTLSRDGVGGIIPADDKVPVMAVLGNYFLLTWSYKNDHALTFKTGFKLRARFGESTLETIDYFMAYARTAAYYTGYSFDSGLDFRGPVWKNFSYKFEVEMFFMPGLKGTWECEQAGAVAWRIGRHVSVMAGCRHVVGEFPFGVDSQWFPQCDLQLAFNPGKK